MWRNEEGTPLLVLSFSKRATEGGMPLLIPSFLTQGGFLLVIFILINYVY
jgi:hypothetical protein